MTLNFDPVDPNATLVLEATIPQGAHSNGTTFALSPTQTHWTAFLVETFSVQAIPLSANPFGVEALQTVDLISGFSTVVDDSPERGETPFQTAPRAPDRISLAPFSATPESFLLKLRVDADIVTCVPVRVRCFFQGSMRKSVPTQTPKKVS